MATIRALFWDVGGVLLTNAWDHEERAQALERFGIDEADFEARHQQAVERFEQGRLSLDGYLDETVFYCPRPFSREEFRDFMFSLSRAKDEVLELARQLSREYVMAIINNESRELNQFRIRKFRLNEVFRVFVSSCFVGIRKPDERIFQLAVDLTELDSAECLFLDDRPVNVDAARGVGMRAVLVENPARLKQDLKQEGVKL